jgi:hypothetical protein
MIQRFALLVVLAMAPFSMFAQDVEKGSAKKSIIQKPSRDFVMLQLGYDAWMKPDSVKTTGIGRAFNAYLCYDFPIKKSNLSFAAGLGIGTSNIYLDNQQLSYVDSNSTVHFINEAKDYKKYKVSTAYLEAPFELRYFGNKENRNKGFKAAIGLRAGTLIGAKTKGRINGTKINEKLLRKDRFENWRFAGTVRLGWGNFSVFGAYNINNLFKENQGPEITPYSVGICLTGL